MTDLATACTPDVNPLNKEFDADGQIVAVALDAFYDEWERWGQPPQTRTEQDRVRVCLARAIGAAFADARRVEFSVQACGSAADLVNPVPTVEKIAEDVFASTRPNPAQIARPLFEWHEDDGWVLWWCPDEPPWVGSPLCSDWPGYHEWWTALPEWPVFPVLAQSAASGEL